MKYTPACIFVILLFFCRFAHAQTSQPDTAHITVISNFELPQLKRHRNIRVYLPAGYQNSGRKYQVIYMQDGQRLFSVDKHSDDSWDIDLFMKQLPPKKQCIIVGIDFSDKYRMTEYNPYDSYYGRQAGIAYTHFLVETLKPYIDAHYRTKPEAKNTTILGSSLGGMISMYAAFKYPGVFGNAGIFSPAFWLSPQIYGDADSTAISKNSRFYFACGDQEGPEADYVSRMDSIIRSKGLTAEQTPVIILKGAKHDEAQWKGDFLTFYTWLMGF